MEKITIAFDVDGTLISNQHWPEDIIPNLRIVELLIILYSFKNTRIVVWSWRGKEWVEKVCKKLDIEKYVDGYYSKNHLWTDQNWKHIFNPDIVPDLAFDDIQCCNLWKINLICKEK